MENYIRALAQYWRKKEYIFRLRLDSRQKYFLRR